jgi:hypothetical protein
MCLTSKADGVKAAPVWRAQLRLVVKVSAGHLPSSGPTNAKTLVHDAADGGAEGAIIGREVETGNVSANDRQRIKIAAGRVAISLVPTLARFQGVILVALKLHAVVGAAGTHLNTVLRRVVKLGTGTRLALTAAARLAGQCVTIIRALLGTRGLLQAPKA